MAGPDRRVWTAGPSSLYGSKKGLSVRRVLPQKELSSHTRTGSEALPCGKR